MGETVAVTGAAGFIGRWVCAELLARGHTVRGLDDLSAGTQANVAAFADDSAFTLTVGDVCEADAVARVLDGATDRCIHLAARIDVHESLTDPTGHLRTNVLGTHTLLEAARAHEVPVAIVGTCMVYDVATADGGIDETHPTAPASPYAATKLAAEELAMGYAAGYGLPVTVLRPFNTYGPYQRADTAGGVVSIFTERDLAGAPLQVYGDGTQTRDLLYVTDCARFIVDAAQSDAAVGEVLNAGTGVEVSIAALAERIAGDGTAVEHVAHHHPQSEVQRLRCDPAKAAELLGWTPQVSLAEGLNRVRAWMEAADA